MKKQNLIVLLICSLLITTSGIAQTFEGKITYKMEAVNLPPDLASMKSMIDNQFTTHIKGNKSRTEVKNVMTGNMILIADQDKKQVVMCMDILGNKSAVTSTMDEYKKSHNKSELDDIKFSKTGEKKTIAGHNCEKAIATSMAEGKPVEVEIWFTRDIANHNSEMSEMPGMPLEYTVFAEQFNMHFLATEISKESVADSMFEVPAGYTKKSSKEFEKEFKQPVKH